MMVALATGDSLEIQDQVGSFERFREQLERAWGSARHCATGMDALRCQAGTRFPASSRMGA